MMRRECEQEVITFLQSQSASTCGITDAFGVSPVRALYLRGASGVGKTHAVNSAARYCNWTVRVVCDIESLHSVLTSSEAQLECRAELRVVHLIENADHIISADSVCKPSVALLRAGLKCGTSIAVIATGTRPLPLALVSVFRECRVPGLCSGERVALLQELVPGCDSGVVAIAAERLGVVGMSDIVDLVARAGVLADGDTVRSEHLREAVAHIGKTGVRRVVWESVGGLCSVKQRLRMAVEWPMRFGASFRRLGIRASRGVLLHGPPGCSKTTLVRAVASGTGARFISLSAADVYSCFLGEAERILRDTFTQARERAPCILFLDEIDAIVGNRGQGGSAGGEISGRVLATLLTEMDGVAACEGVVVVAATNRLECVDEALRRPGRFDDVLEVPLPDFQDRLEILGIYCADVQLADDVDLVDIARKTCGLSGAHLKGICKEAALTAAREIWNADTGFECPESAEDLNHLPVSISVCRRHFELSV